MTDRQDDIAEVALDGRALEAATKAISDDFLLLGGKLSRRAAEAVIRAYLALALALAALAAIREPTEAMVDGEARNRLLNDRLHSPRTPKAEVISDIWRAMVD